MNSLKDLAESHGFNYQNQAACCPDKAYRKETIFAIVRASTTTRYIFISGQTLTIGHKTRYATFPRSDLYNTVSEALQELKAAHPLTRNLYLTES